ncbi:ribonucleoside-diphosphate reductase [Salix suchowensis]|nr:ribonucleoside-diphosphate reductase [Salix suchowensis]
MSNSMEQTLEGEGNNNRGSEQNPNQSQEWETMARLWLSAFAGVKAVSTMEVETWIDSNYSSLPSDLQSMHRSDLIDRLLSIQKYMRLPTQNQVTETNQADVPHARFQRTDQWLPVYSWLESLDKDEVVKSKDISDWLTENPEIREQLFSRHSRYHLMHYIKKCHVKILKRRERKKGVQATDNPTSPKSQKNVGVKELAPVPTINPLNNIPKDSELYVSKRNEALQKYEILLELEKKLTPYFSKHQALKN